MPNPPVVRDESGKVLGLAPTDILPRVEVYGQHEISELTKRPEKLPYLLYRFLKKDDDLAARKRQLHSDLERSRGRILETQKDIVQIEEELTRLPALEETLRSYKDAGLEETLREQSLIVREERVLDTADERLIPFLGLIDSLKQELPIGRAFLSEKALEGLPGVEILKAADGILERLDRDMERIYSSTRNALDLAGKDFSEVRRLWDLRKRQVQEAYEKILRDLQKSNIDGEEFIRLRRQIEGLRPMKERKTALLRDMTAFQEERRNLLVEWEDVKADEFRSLKRAAKKVSRKLKDRVLVEVMAAGNREPLFVLMREQIGGRLSEAIDILKQMKDFSLPLLSKPVEKGVKHWFNCISFPLRRPRKSLPLNWMCFSKWKRLSFHPKPASN